MLRPAHTPGDAPPVEISFSVPGESFRRVLSFLQLLSCTRQNAPPAVT
jgi:hypothetical protein